MTTMTRVQAEALTAFVVRVRTDWRPAGVLAALERAAPGADVYDVARALLNLAGDNTVKTPGLLDRPGPHWRKPSGDMPSRRGDHNVNCPEHPQNTHPCPDCATKRSNPSPEYLAAKAEALANAKPKPRQPKPLTADVTAARERIDGATT